MLAGLAARRMPSSNRSWLPVSTDEWIASLSRAALPVVRCSAKFRRGDGEVADQGSIDDGFRGGACHEDIPRPLWCYVVTGMSPSSVGGLSTDGPERMKAKAVIAAGSSVCAGAFGMVKRRMLGVASIASAKSAKPAHNVILSLPFAWGGEYLHRRSGLDQFAQMEERHLIGATGSLLHVMGDQDDRHVMLQVADQVLNRIQCACGLVEQDHLRPRRKGSGNDTGVAAGRRTGCPLGWRVAPSPHSRDPRGLSDASTRSSRPARDRSSWTPNAMFR